jgi:hypothetical protein
MNAGDGLKSISTIRVPVAFARNYLTLTPVVDADMPAGTLNLGILTSDNNVPANTAVVRANPANTVLPTTDRQTILEVDSTFTAIPLPATPAQSIDSTGTFVTVSATDIGRFTVGEIYFITSTLGGTFGTVTAINNGTNTLTFGDADDYGLNLTGNGGHIKAISTNGTIATSLMRMRIIHYYIDADRHLIRREFGIRRAGFRDTIIAEHVLDVQLSYALNITDAAGNVAQPVAMLSTPEERLAVRQVEVTINVETPHTISGGLQPLLRSTTSTSIRNMQFRQSLQPTAGS